MTIILLLIIIIQNAVLRYEIDDLKEQVLSLQHNTYNQIKHDVLEKVKKSIQNI